VWEEAPPGLLPILYPEDEMENLDEDRTIAGALVEFFKEKGYGWCKFDSFDSHSLKVAPPSDKHIVVMTTGHHSCVPSKQPPGRFYFDIRRKTIKIRFTAPDPSITVDTHDPESFDKLLKFVRTLGFSLWDRLLENPTLECKRPSEQEMEIIEELCGTKDCADICGIIGLVTCPMK